MRRSVTRLYATLFFTACLMACAHERDVVPQAVLLSDKGRYDEARQTLEAHLAGHPGDTRARRLLIRIYGFLGDLGRARAEAERLAALLGPGSPTPWIELGHALELTHRYDEALAFYDRAAEVAPSDPEGPRTGGERTARWGEHELARPRLEEALRRAPRDAKTWHTLGVVCLGLGDVPGAEHAYRSGLMADPRALENRVGLATVALLEHDASAALREYETILAARPSFADAELGRSWALIELTRFDEAEQALTRAHELGADPRIVARQRRALADRRRTGAPAEERSPEPR
ncbi:MAG TPA: tetratricopeptide repeat protein [Polyangiaceae bacterium]